MAKLTKPHLFHHTKSMDYIELFNQLYPDYFGEGKLSYMDEESVYEEMIMYLQKESCGSETIPDFASVSIPVPENVSFGIFDWKNATDADKQKLLAAVESVDSSWPQYFNGKEPVFCGFYGDEIASFCSISTMGTAVIDSKKYLVGGPGCVGTVPKFRKQGIGLKMVQQVTEILQKKGFDISFIHYTGVAPWYAKLGYKTILKWNKNGFIK